MGKAGRVIAFEPQRLAFQMLCGNMAINSVTSADCRQAAVGWEPGTILVPQLAPDQVNNFGGLSLGVIGRGEMVPVTTLDSLDLPACSLLKVDVEGMEADVLLGGERMIRKFRPILYVENDRQENSDELIRLVDTLGYRMYWHRPYLFNPKNFSGNPENVFGAVASINMICVPKESETRVEDFPPVEVPPPGGADGPGDVEPTGPPSA